MKKILLMALILFYAVLSFSGLPSEDPKVAELKSLFINSHEPSAKNFRFGEKIYCKIFSAYPRSDFVFEDDNYYEFSQHDGIIFDRVYENSYELTPRGALRTYIYGWYHHYYAIRVTENGGLIAEESQDISSYEGVDESGKVVDPKGRAHSVIHPNFFVNYYVFCPAK